MMADVTVVICARNAASTIGRAVASAAAEGHPIVLVDDWSDDRTADIARSVARERVVVVRPPEHRSLGLARQTGLSIVCTKWLMWLDADDQLLPGRAATLKQAALSLGCDAVWDAVELWDGVGDSFVRELAMPGFMQRRGAGVRLFERNHTPGPAWPLVRTELAKRVAYDPSLPTADDLDFMLRGLQEGGRFGFVAKVGYRQYAYPGSLSRSLDHQRAWVARVLRRHGYNDVRTMYRAAGYAKRIAAWGVVSMALFCEEPEAALRFLDEASPVEADPDEILEHDGPWPFREGWRRAFQRGTCLLMLGGRDAEAAAELVRAEAQEPTAEGANNLGVALVRLGRIDEAQALWRTAGSRFPGYLDARMNSEDPSVGRITTHPLRRFASRSEY